MYIYVIRFLCLIYYFLWNGEANVLTQLEGVILFIGLIAFLVLLIRSAKKDKESIDKMYANNMQEILDLDKNDPNYKEKRAKLERQQEELTKGVAKMNSVSATVLATKIREEGDDEKTKKLTLCTRPANMF